MNAIRDSRSQPTLNTSLPRTVTTCRTKPTLLALALVAAGLHAPGAFALGLGALEVKSALGEPFRAEIRMLGTPGAALEPSCLSLQVPPTGNSDDLPWLSRARFRIQGNTVHVLGSESLNHPILMVGLKLSCGYEVAREYTALLEPTTVSVPAESPANSEPVQAPIEPVALPTKAPRSRERSDTGAPGAPVKPRPVAKAEKTAAPGKGRGGDQLVVSTEGQATPKKAAEPPAATPSKDTHAEKQLLNVLDDQVATLLTITDKVQALENRLAELNTQLASVQSEIAKVEATREAQAAALAAMPSSISPAAQIPSGGPSVGSAEWWLTLGAAASVGLGFGVGGAWLTRRRSAPAPLARYEIAADNAPDSELPSPVAATQTAASPSLDRTDQANIEVSGEAFPPVDFQRTAVIPATQAPLSETVVNVPALDIELGSHAEAALTTSVFPASDAKLDLEFEPEATEVRPVLELAPADTQRLPPPPRLVSTQPVNENVMQFDPSVAVANEESVPSHDHVIELAEIMLSFGRTEGAAQTLTDYLRDYPKQAVTPWLKLLELYRGANRRGEYDDLAQRLNRTFNVKVPDWDDFDGPKSGESLEQYAHIMNRIIASWGAPEGLDYLRELLRDNRSGTRQGFPLGVIDDILLLEQVLKVLVRDQELRRAGTVAAA